MKKLIITCLSFSLLLLLSACGNNVVKNDNNNENIKKIVYTSFYPMYDFTKKIVGDKLEVRNVVPIGSEPHDYELTSSDRKNLENADAIVYSGLGMEEWLDDLKDANKDKKINFIFASEGISYSKSEASYHKNSSDSDDDYDPHVWLLPSNAKIQLKNIKDALEKIDPDNYTYYEENYNKYSKELDALDELYTSKLKDYRGRTIIVSHEAFGYIAREYGLVQKGIEGLSPESEPSPKKMAEIIDYVKNNDIKVIFFEELVSPKVSEAVARETGAETRILNPLEGLSQKDIDEGKEYISIMKENLDSLIYSFSK